LPYKWKETCDELLLIGVSLEQDCVGGIIKRKLKVSLYLWAPRRHVGRLEIILRER
jgi:hypothetical protein